MSIVVIIDGKAVAKGRGRHAVVNGRARVFTPAHTRSYENRIKDAAAEAMGARNPIEGAVEVWVHVLLPYPKSASKKKLAEMVAGRIRPCTKPDIDNYVKSALDGINSIVIKDDNQVVELHAYKLYHAKPLMRIEVREYFGHFDVEGML